jgi:hypothetical protein
MRHGDAPSNGRTFSLIDRLLHELRQRQRPVKIVGHLHGVVTRSIVHDYYFGIGGAQFFEDRAQSLVAKSETRRLVIGGNDDGCSDGSIVT